MIEVRPLDITDSATVDRLAELTFEAFKENAPKWLPTMDHARQQVLAAGTPGRLGRVAVVGKEVAGWIGAIEGKRVWEIHPLAVAIEHQYSGLGRRLVEEVAQIARRVDALTLFAGTSDEVGTTNLFNVDLYRDPASAIRALAATARNPYKFWESAGFTVVGVMPDVEGRGKPAIHLARRL